MGINHAVRMSKRESLLSVRYTRFLFSRLIYWAMIVCSLKWRFYSRVEEEQSISEEVNNESKRKSFWMKWQKREYSMKKKKKREKSKRKEKTRSKKKSRQRKMATDYESGNYHGLCSPNEIGPKNKKILIQLGKTKANVSNFIDNWCVMKIFLFPSKKILSPLVSVKRFGLRKRKAKKVKLIEIERTWLWFEDSGIRSWS